MVFSCLDLFPSVLEHILSQVLNGTTNRAKVLLYHPVYDVRVSKEGNTDWELLPWEMRIPGHFEHFV